MNKYRRKEKKIVPFERFHKHFDANIITVRLNGISYPNSHSKIQNNGLMDNSINRIDNIICIKNPLLIPVEMNSL